MYFLVDLNAATELYEKNCGLIEGSKTLDYIDSYISRLVYCLDDVHNAKGPLDLEQC